MIDGGYPLMFGPAADLGHKIMRFVYTGPVPKQVWTSAPSVSVTPGGPGGPARCVRRFLAGEHFAQVVADGSGA